MLPSIADYKNALRTPADSFRELTYLRPVAGVIDDFYFSSGNFAVVFKMQDTRNGAYKALKCFTREQERREQSLAKISAYFERNPSPYIVPYRYYEEELWAADSDMPVLLMDWVEGDTLGTYVKKCCDRHDTMALYRLLTNFAQMGQHLLAQPWAHGDLKHDNIIVKPDGGLVLVDYDGAFVPTMQGEAARETGSPCYRHPARTAADFDTDIDDFALLVIQISLLALHEKPSLLAQHCNDENLLFNPTDFKRIGDTPLYHLLRSLSQNADIQLLMPLLEYMIRSESRKAFGLEKALAKYNNVATIKPTPSNSAKSRVATIKTTPSNFTESYLDLDMIFVAGGSFMMGSSDDDSYADDNEKPQHRVTLSDFYIGKTPITQRQWREVMGDNPSSFKGRDDCPVERVSWEDAQTFIKKLNKKSSPLKYRLPTEAEWEYAARGGQKSKGYYYYAGSDNLDEVAWYEGNANWKTQPVATKKANELGIYDMSGNIWEWCNDWYDGNYYRNSPEKNPQGATYGVGKVFRGGSWFNDFDYCRVAVRNGSNLTNRYALFGFRLCLGT